MKILVFIFPIFSLMISLRGLAQCFYSADGDSLLYVDGYQTSWDSTQCTFWFWYTTLVSEPGEFSPRVTGNFVDSYTTPLEPNKWIPDFHFPDSLVSNYPNVAEDIYYPEQIDSIINLDVRVESCKRLSYEQGWCSKGCSWTSYYVAELDFSFSIRGTTVWKTYFKKLYFIYGDYIEWGKKPKNRTAGYFEQDPYAVMRVDCYHLKEANKFFMHFLYSTVPIKDNRATDYPEVYFLF